MKANVATYTFNNNQKGFIESVYKHAEKHAPQETLDKFNEKYTAVDIQITEINQGNSEIGIEEFEAEKMSKILETKEGARFYKIIEILPKEYRSLNDSKGYVIADYQQFLEAKWVKSLKDEFKIEFKNDVLNTLVK